MVRHLEASTGPDRSEDAAVRIRTEHHPDRELMNLSWYMNKGSTHGHVRLFQLAIAELLKGVSRRLEFRYGTQRVSRSPGDGLPETTVGLSTKNCSLSEPDPKIPAEPQPASGFPTSNGR
jgi:hypothetical protein